MPSAREASSASSRRLLGGDAAIAGGRAHRRRARQAYRPGGSTIHQVISTTCPDSHINAYRPDEARSRRGRAHDQDLRGSLGGAARGSISPIAMSLDLLDALHRRSTAFLRALPATDFRKTFRHAEWGLVTVDKALAHVMRGIAAITPRT